MSDQLRMGCRSDKGPRRTNQDSVHIDASSGVAVVADGMGGAAGGAEASEMAVTLTVQLLGERMASARPGSDLTALLDATVREVNREVYEKGEATPELQGMGTTLVAAVFRNGRYHIANVGDSRAYRVRGSDVEQLTRDHSLVQARVEAGLISADEAGRQPDRNVITRAIGTQESVQAQLIQGETQSGDVFILTSDGVHGTVPTDVFAEAASEGEADEISLRLVEEAVSRGTTDNATAAVVFVGNHEDPSERNTELDRILNRSGEVTGAPGGTATPANWLWPLILALVALAAAAAVLLVYS